MALVLGMAAAILLAVGSAVPVVDGASRGYSSTALLVVLSVLPMALVAVCLLRGRPVTVIGVLAGAAAIAPGRAILDMQLLTDPSSAARPELYRSVVFAMPGPAAGLWLLLAGHVATVAAGVVGLRALGPRSEPDARGGVSSGDARGLLLAGVFAAAVAAVGVMMKPFSTDDAFLPAGSAFESPALVLAGCLVLAFGLVVAAGLATSSGTTAIATGGLLGLAVAAVAVAVPNLVSGLAVTGVGLSAGPIVMLVGVAGLLVVARISTTGDRHAGETDDMARRVRSLSADAVERADGAGEAGEARLPGLRRLWTATGVLAVLTAAASLAGALTAQVVVVDGLPSPNSPSQWVLVVAGLLVGALGVAMFVPTLAGKVRPALSVCWAGVPLAATAVMTTAITASELGAAGLSPGPGVLWAALAVVGAVATACCSVVAGMVERDSGDAAEGDRPGPNLITPLVAGGILAVGGFGVPSILATDYVEPTLWSDFGTPSWGLLVAMLTVLGVCVLAPRCRPARATALLTGATCLAGLRVAELPLTMGIDGIHAGVGWWLALGCAAALLIATGIAPRTAPASVNRVTSAGRH